MDSTGLPDSGSDEGFDYRRADIRIDGVTVAQVGVRKKGFLGSVVSTRPSLKVKFDEYVDGQTFAGLDGLTLNNNNQDQSLMQQFLAYDLYTRAELVLFSRSDWDDSVHVHLLWPPPSPAGNIAGYKLLRSVRAPACTTSAQCPAASCDDNGCTPQVCTSGFCGGPDAGPADPHLQEDREALLTNGLEHFQSGPQPVEWAKLRSLAALGNLYVRDPVSGAPVLAAPGCRLPAPGPGCEGSCTRPPAPATRSTARTRCRARRPSRCTSTGSWRSARRGSKRAAAWGPGASRRPSRCRFPTLSHRRARISRAFSPRWPRMRSRSPGRWRPSRTPSSPGRVTRCWRAELEEAPGSPQLAPNTGSYSPTGLADDGCYRFDVRPVAATGVPAGSPLVTVTVVGSAAEEIAWPVTADATQVAIERRQGTLAPVHAGRLLPGPTLQTVDGLKIATIDFGAAIATLRVRDRPPEAERDYCYALRLADLAGNLSEPSRAQLGRRVDISPPAPPDELRAERALGEVAVRWSHAEAALRITVKRSSVGADGPWRTLAAAAEPREVADESATPAVLDTWSAGGVSEYRFRDLGARPEQS